MPRVLKRPKFKDDDVVVCWMPFSSDDPSLEIGGLGVVPRGARLRASHPAVKKHPHYFVEDGTPDAEMPRMEPPPIVRDPLTVTLPTPIPDEEAVVATETFTVGDRYFHAGARYRRDDEIVQRHPEYFSTVSARLPAA